MVSTSFGITWDLSSGRRTQTARCFVKIAAYGVRFGRRAFAGGLTTHPRQGVIHETSSPATGGIRAGSFASASSASVLAAAAGAGSLAYATILVNQSVIHGCAAKSGGALRLASKCRANERAVIWNNTGPAGARGATGLQGAAGSQGAPGAAGATGATGAPGVNRDVIGGGDGGCADPGRCCDLLRRDVRRELSSLRERESPVQLAMPANGTVQELHATVSPAPGAGNSFTFTIRKNGASTSVACTDQRYGNIVRGLQQRSRLQHRAI